VFPYAVDVKKNPVFYAAIMILWLIALPGSLITSSDSGIDNVMSLVVPATHSLLILGSVEAIIIAQCEQ
jgi:hypothetical protein